DGTDADAEVAVYNDAEQSAQAFALAPGTPVKVVERKEVAPRSMVKVMTFDGRQGWVSTKFTKEEQKTGKGVYTLKSEQKNYYEMVCGWVLAKKIELDGKYAFYGIKWPEISGEQEEEKTLDDSAVKTLEFEVPELSDYEFRGKTVKAHQIVTARQDDDDFTIAVTPDNKVLAFWPTDAPIAFIMGTEEESKNDIQKEAAAGADDVKACLKVYFDVLAKEADAEALDDVMDWESIRVEMSAIDPSYADITAEEAGKKIKEQFARVPKALTAEQVSMLLDMIEVTIDGEEAQAPLPGRDDDPFLFKKIDGKWKIVHFTT
ncbi:MAG: SH3 domain-containing protein, partial [Planctomycetota bacterium]